MDGWKCANISIALHSLVQLILFNQSTLISESSVYYVIIAMRLVTLVNAHFMYK